MSENKVSLSETRPVFYFTSVVFVVLYSGHNATLQEKNYMLLTEG